MYDRGASEFDFEIGCCVTNRLQELVILCVFKFNQRNACKMTDNDNIQVCIRMRRKIPREENSENLWMVENASQITEIGPNHRPFVFDRVFGESDSTEHIYNELIAPVIHKAMEGINGTIFAYGQTSSGKTYTMLGSGDRNCQGIIPMCIDHIYSEIEMIPNRAFLLKVSYFEIYNDRVTDLLSLEDRNLDLLEDENGDIHVSNCTEEIVNSPAVAMNLMKKGEAKRRFKRHR